MLKEINPYDRSFFQSSHTDGIIGSVFTGIYPSQGKSKSPKESLVFLAGHGFKIDNPFDLEELKTGIAYRFIVSSGRIGSSSKSMPVQLSVPLRSLNTKEWREYLAHNHPKIIKPNDFTYMIGALSDNECIPKINDMVLRNDFSYLSEILELRREDFIESIGLTQRL